LDQGSINLIKLVVAFALTVLQNTVSFLGASLAETMGKMTSDFRIGFGAFVDKVTMPFVSTSPKK
jgi:hypothetical protein